MSFLLEAIEVTDDPAEIAELLERAGEARRSSAGASNRAEPLLRDAIAAASRTLGDRSGAARATALLGEGIVNAWRSKDAADILEPAVVAYGDLVDDAALAAIEHQLARAYWFQDRDDEAIVLADRAIGRAERIEAVGLIADALITKGALSRVRLASVRRRPASLEAGIRLAESLGLNATVVRGLLNLGRVVACAATRGSRSIAAARPPTSPRGSVRATATRRRSATPGRPRSTLGEWDWALARPRTSPASSTSSRRTGRRSCARAKRSWPARGESVDDLLAEHERLIGNQSDVQQESNLVGGHGSRRVRRGRYREAAEGGAVGRTEPHATRATDLPRAARAMLWAGDPTASGPC